VQDELLLACDDADLVPLQPHQVEFEGLVDELQASAYSFEIDFELVSGEAQLSPNNFSDDPNNQTEYPTELVKG
jgi:hypothetical protein